MVDREQFFKGWPKPEQGFRCLCRPDGDYGPVDIMITMADGRELSARIMGVMCSPYSPDVLQVDYDAILSWGDGTAMNTTERRQVSMIICWSHESQLYASKTAQQEYAP